MELALSERLSMYYVKPDLLPKIVADSICGKR
ncbi:hypothetical protein JOD55_001449 [Arcanobacterium pluranimalium]|nr:hypothetical protein [Arcanobacterium pluranimalium]